MIVIVGYLLCLGCIFGAFIIHGGNISVILHAMPTEMMAIGGGAIGAFLVNNQPKVVKAATLSGVDNVLFRRNSVSGAVEAVPWQGQGTELNAALHAN